MKEESVNDPKENFYVVFRDKDTEEGVNVVNVTKVHYLLSDSLFIGISPSLDITLMS